MSLFKFVVGLCMAVGAMAAPDQLKLIRGLPNDQESIGLKMEWMFDLFARQEQRIESLELTVERQEAEIANLKQNVRETKAEGRREEKAVILRTCEDIRSTVPDATSGTYWIDPDGVGSGDPPISVYCDLTTGSTLISHDSELQIEAAHCYDPGCYSRSIAYNATMRQITALTNLSRSCRQFFRFDCFSVPLQFDGVQQAWWTDRHGDVQFFWAGSNFTAHTCQCGIDGNCVVPDVRCNCDTSTAYELNDNGYIANKELLPVTKLNFGRTLSPNSSGRHTLGKFECTGRATSEKLPESCDDLWLIGHTLNGFYDVKGDKEIRSVYCDFSKLPGDQETAVGVVDVQSTPVYFYVQRNTSHSAALSTVPFQIEKVNVGGGMNFRTGVFTAPVSGIYYFSFHGHKSGTDSHYLELLHNSNNVAMAYSDNNGAGIDGLSLSSTLALNSGDTVSLRLDKGTLFSNGVHYVNFNGMLLKEDISL